MQEPRRGVNRNAGVKLVAFVDADLGHHALVDEFGQFNVAQSAKKKHLMIEWAGEPAIDQRIIGEWSEVSRKMPHVHRGSPEESPPNLSP
jgi:hypothetical protein